MDRIESLNNQTIKEVVALKKAGERRDQGRIIIDGAREILLALESGVEIIKVFYCPELGGEAKGASRILKTDNVFSVSEKVFRKLCYKENPDGFLAITRKKELTLKDFKPSSKALLVVLEKVEKPGNLGAILRTARAAGVEAIILNDNQTDIYNPNVIRASEGFVFTEKVIISSVVETLAWLKKNKIKSFAAATNGAKDLYKTDLSGPAAIVLGSEADGLSEQWLKSADKTVKIPMKKAMDSLNVSVSAAIILFEAVRQRGK